MQGALYSPTVPGVTERSTDPGKMASLHEALAAGDDLKDQEGRDRARANALVNVAREWFEAAAWYHREAIECDAMYHGAQWGYWSSDEGRFIAQPEARTRWTLRLVLNLTKPIVDAAVSILAGEELIFIAGAAKTGVRDTATSQCANGLVNYFWRQHNLPQKYVLSARGQYVKGMSFILVEWDESLGRLVTLQEPVLLPNMQTGKLEPLINPQTGQPFTVQKKKSEGDLRISITPVQSVAPDPAATEDQDGAGITIKREMSRATLNRRFGKEKASKVWTQTRDDDTGVGRLGENAEKFSAMRAGTWTGDEVQKDTATIYTTYVAKTDDMPQGKLLIYTDNVILWEGDNPAYPTADEPDEPMPRYNWPLFAARCDVREGSYFGKGRVVDLAHPQRQINGIVSSAMLHVATISRTKILLPVGVNAEWTDEIGQIIRYGRQVDARGIGYLNPAAMPQEYVTLWDKIEAAMEKIGGINSQTTGQLPSADTSGRALQQLQQRDTSRLSIARGELRRAWNEVMVCALRLFRRHADVKRKITVLGANRQAQMFEFDRSDLAAPVDVVVANDSSIPQDPIQRMLWMTQLAQTLATMEGTKWGAKLARMWRLNEFEDALEAESYHEAKAEAENLDMIATPPRPVGVWQGDDHLAHKDIHEKLITSREFREQVEQERLTYGGRSPLEETALMHWQQHDYYLQMQAAAAAPPPPAAPGAGGDKPMKKEPAPAGAPA